MDPSEPTSCVLVLNQTIECPTENCFGFGSLIQLTSDDSIWVSSLSMVHFVERVEGYHWEVTSSVKLPDPTNLMPYVSGSLFNLGFAYQVQAVDQNNPTPEANNIGYLLHRNNSKAEWKIRYQSSF